MRSVAAAARIPFVCRGEDGRPTFMGKPIEPAERDPGFGWLRSRWRKQWVNPGRAACGRVVCPVCGAPAGSVARGAGG